MPIFILTSILVPLLTVFVLPKLLDWYTGTKGGDMRLLIAAASLFFISWYLPSPDIQGEQTAAVTHYVGGGLYSGLVWLYLKHRFRWKTTWLLELLSLMALVSLLGTANELFELALVGFGLVNMTLDDTSWDLLMNTIGALTVYVAYRITRWGIKRHG